ncbi:MAG: ankyrin repeat domain-containing protein [Spirochaetaceae bacterium]|nr:ankyrin repeat domain-containing protein [Spirochaetaceae bacterium]
MTNYEALYDMAMEDFCENHCTMVETCDGSTCTHPEIQKVQEMDLIDMFQAGNMIMCSDCQVRSAFLFAVHSGETVEIIKQMLESGADVNEEDEDGQTALMFAVSNNAIQSVELLLNAGAEIDAQDIEGFTALMHGITKGSLESVECLLKAGANPFISDDDITVFDLIHEREPSIQTEQLNSLFSQYLKKM